MNNSSFKFNSIIGTKNESSLDKTNLYSAKDQISNRQSMPSGDNKFDKNTIAAYSKINVPNNMNINTTKSRNIKDNFLKNNILFNSNKTPKSYQNKFLMSNYVPGAKSGGNIGISGGISGTIGGLSANFGTIGNGAGSNGTISGNLNIVSKNVINNQNKLSILSSNSKEKLYVLNGNYSTSNNKLLTLKTQLNHVREKYFKNQRNKSSFDSLYKN